MSEMFSSQYGSIRERVISVTTFQLCIRLNKSINKNITGTSVNTCKIKLVASILQSKNTKRVSHV